MITLLETAKPITVSQEIKTNFEDKQYRSDCEKEPE
jgi:hypothetical protein